VIIFDVIVPFLLAVPLAAAAALQLSAGRYWLSQGSARGLKDAPQGAASPTPS
jgi:hypothetical protein